jgi:hypothetical protein
VAKRTIAGILLTFFTSVIILSNALNCTHHRKSVLLQALEKDTDYRDLIIEYPADSTVFPPEIIPPTLTWRDPAANSNTWFICVELQGAADLLTFICDTMRWTPGYSVWETIKRHSLDKKARIIVAGFDHRAPHDISSRAEISIFTSKDKVGAPIFYRDVNLPFIDAVKDPSRIKWRLGDISSPTPPRVVLEKLPVCGNCHSFSADAKYLAMDVDYANDKGSYVITRVAEEMRLATSEIITWEDFEKKSDMNRPLFDRDIETFGLLSQISPDGDFVISTVRDQSVFVDKSDLGFSQLFFPVKGILAFYSRREKKFSALPGAENPKYVQSNPSWSPDGDFIVFARSKTYEFKHRSVKGKVLLTQEECEEFLKDGRPFLFDLYRIPFNNGKGAKRSRWQVRL